MVQTLLTKRSAVASKVPVVGDLQLGELGLNTYDGKVFMRKNNGTDSIVEIGAQSNVLVDATNTRIVNPGGGAYASQTSPVVGALKIVMPSFPINGMLRMTIRVYEFITGNAFDLYCGGFTYTSGNTWANNPFAYIVGANGTNRNFTIRFGATAGGKAVIYIGELGTAWSYPQFFVTDVQVGYAVPGGLATGWSLGIEAAAFENVTATITNPQVGYSTTANVGNSDVRRDASGNFSAGTITATLAGNATSATSATSASSATLATKASTLAQGGGNGTAMTFAWSGQSGQPTWLWGSNDGATINVWNPSNFNVNSATSATSATNATNAANLNGFTNSSSGNPIVGPDSVTQNGIGYVNNISLFGQSDGALRTQMHSSPLAAQQFQDYRTGQMAIRGKNSGTWTAWRTVYDSSNLTNLNQLSNGPGFITGAGSTTGTARGLTRSDSAADAFNVQSWWNGVRWELKGYNSTTFHAGVMVDYATSAGSAASCSGNAASATSANSAAILTGQAKTNGSDGWFRSMGGAGWYNETYSVGLYATEAGNIRAYNGANIISDNNIVGRYTIGSVNAAITAAGTTQGTATTVATQINVVTVASANQGVLLPSAVAGMLLTFINASAAAILVYPGGGAQIDAIGVNVGFSLGAGARLQFVASTTGQWYSLTGVYA